MKILVIHGPNLNLLGEREPGVYGDETFEKLNSDIMKHAEKSGVECEIYQSNHEGMIIDKLHDARTKFDGVVINAGAYTHYSYAIRDAISAIKIPCIEVHISNINARDEFRKTSVIGPVCRASIAGFGRYSYILGMDGLIRLLSEE
ncbi:MAG: type II 3-dehydroquinate dehydratase [Oscillospiraceae bacterium]|nr:type II 3-dehydroquinate dehydratase [Ruminococcus sp.]MBP1566346.1 type II 3-dehydroquinate dehydratase [Oscillospiraceae bacterium]MBQ9982454.1 type II 3-dehydroquinate dehydratase [Oscillospiraceae bacterium]MBR6599287.1 type II 3-dehydroquinate dehydratase [Oscillospiraceae bacterium]